MEVTSHLFYASVYDILRNFVGCSFVAIDLEFSSAPAISEVRKVSSLQERYQEIRKAAQKYSVIQLGITIVRRDQAGCYIAYPYNIHLNPLLLQKLQIDRAITFESRALSFLLRHGFDLQRLVEDGVPYLSRREANTARKQYSEANRRTDLPDIILKEDQTDLQQFMDRTRREVRDWYDSNLGELVLSNEAYLVTRATHTGLTSVERRLARQIIRNEFPDLDVQRCEGSLIVKKADNVLLHVLKNRDAAVLEEIIHQQTGARWIIEGLCGAQVLKQAHAVRFIELASGRPVLVDTTKAAAEFSELCDALHQTRPVIAGHNLFADLVYLYNTFFGHLPEQASDFFQLIHGIFPRIVDTKFLATAKNVDRRSSSLQDVCQQYEHQGSPPFDITDDLAFSRYRASAHSHEAGYDSFMTARIAVKLAGHLASIDGYVSPINLTAPSSPKSESSDLIDLSDPEPIGQGKAGVAESASCDFNLVMPDWDSPFWTVYGNRLRIYGTVEGEVHLGNFEKPPA